MNYENEKKNVSFSLLELLFPYVGCDQRIKMFKRLRALL